MHGEHGGWRYGRRWCVSAVAGAALGVAACSGGGAPAPSRSSTTATVTAPTPSLTPEQQAAEQAKQALGSYQRTIDAVYQRGGTDAQRDLPMVATGQQLKFLIDDAKRAQTNHWRQVGQSKVRSIGVRTVSISSGKPPEVFLDVCLDLSGTDTVDSAGKSIRKPGTLPAFRQIIMLTQVGGKRWLVSKEQDTPVKSC